MAPQPNRWLHGTLIFSPDNNPLEPLATDEAVLAYFQEKTAIRSLDELRRCQKAA